MKTLNFRKYLVTTLLQMVVFSLVFADEGQFTKKFKKEYSVNKDTRLQLDNKYGNIDIKNWEKNSISVDVTITVKTSNEEKAQKLFDQIHIDFSESGNLINVKTEFDENFGKFFHNDNDKLIDIYYSVMMPKNVPLDLANKYGNVFINELTSTSTIDIKYGNLKANKILHNDVKPLTQITLGYSNADIQEVAWTKFDIKYSKIEVEDSKALVILSRYSKIYITKGTSMVTESKYDTYRLGKITNLVATSAYSNYKADEVSNKILTETKYTDVHVNRIPAGFESIKVTSSYGNYTLAIDPNASYTLDGYAKYAKISYPDNARVNRFNENNEQKVNGKIGSNQNSKATVTINTNYGGVKLVD